MVGNIIESRKLHPIDLIKEQYKNGRISVRVVKPLSILIWNPDSILLFLFTPFVKDEIIEISSSISFSPDLMILSLVGKIKVANEEKTIDHIITPNNDNLGKLEWSDLHLRLNLFKTIDIITDKISWAAKCTPVQNKKRFKKELDIDTITIPTGKEMENISNKWSLPCVRKNITSNPSQPDAPIKRRASKIEIILILIFFSFYLVKIIENKLSKLILKNTQIKYT